MTQQQALSSNANADLSKWFTGIEFSLSDIKKVLQARDYNKVIAMFDCIFVALRKEHVFLPPNVELKGVLTSLMELLFTYFLIPNNHIPQDQPSVVRVINWSAGVAHLTHFSRYKTTDGVLQEVLKQPNNLIKILALYSPYNQIELDLELMFKAHPYLVSVWLSNMITNFSCNVSAPIRDKFIQWTSHPAVYKHYQALSYEYLFSPTTFVSSFNMTYLNPAQDSGFKLMLNQQIQAVLKQKDPIIKEPDFKRILLISNFFRLDHAVYTSLAPLIRTLKPEYHITQLAIIDPDITYKPFDKSIIDAHHECPVGEFIKAPSKLIASLKNSTFGITLFTDIGMEPPGITLSNLRISPIQIAMYGHPVSTHGSCVDYFIGGAEVEAPSAQEHYSEKLVLIPGLAAVPVKKENYTPQHKDLTQSKEVIDIACNWGELKMHFDHISLLRKILDQTSKKICFHFLSVRQRFGRHLGIFEAFENYLGQGNFRIITPMKAEKYLTFMEACDFGIDSYPFGSYNRVMDMLYCHMPIITRQGEHAYNRLASALLRRVGLDELIATTDAMYVEKTLRLIEDDTYRNQLVERLRALDLDALLFDKNQTESKWFRRAVDYLVAHHETLKSCKDKTPLVMA